jgi:hypothetical protein
VKNLGVWLVFWVFDAEQDLSPSTSAMGPSKLQAKNPNEQSHATMQLMAKRPGKWLLGVSNLEKEPDLDWNRQDNQ